MISRTGYTAAHRETGDFSALRLVPFRHRRRFESEALLFEFSSRLVTCPHFPRGTSLPGLRAPGLGVAAVSRSEGSSHLTLGDRNHDGSLPLPALRYVGMWDDTLRQGLLAHPPRTDQLRCEFCHGSLTTQRFSPPLDVSPTTFNGPVRLGRLVPCSHRATARPRVHSSWHSELELGFEDLRTSCKLNNREYILLCCTRRNPCRLHH
jgi:hypothetical protein